MANRRFTQATMSDHQRHVAGSLAAKTSDSVNVPSKRPTTSTSTA